MSAQLKQISCDENLIAAYVDGELEPANRISVELHLEGCTHCRAELRAHRLFVCELDSVLTQSEVTIPSDFSRMVAARATSDLRGIRSASENKKALAFCLILAVTALGLLSDASRVTALNALRQLARTVISIASVLWTALYDMVASVIVISRVLSRKLVVESNSLGLLLVLFALAVLLLSRMIVSYHRTGATE
jgi:anti-sigma factor RsiW